MRTAAIAFLLALAASLALTPLVRWAAFRLGVLDHALNSRKIHGRPVPRLGGLAIVLAFYTPLAGLALVRAGADRFLFADTHRTAGLLLGGAAMAAVGLWDDLRGSSAGLKFAVQFAVAAFAWWMGFRIESIVNPFGPALPLGPLSLPFTVLWVAGVTNALNLIDGLDGLAGGVALSAVVVTFAGALGRGDPLLSLFAACLAGSILGFLRYNFHPASIFMGDAGSMFLGFVLAATSISASAKASAAVALVVPVVALALPIADTLLAIGRRMLRGSPLFLADREHIHHKLLALGLTQRQVALMLYGVCVMLGTAAIALGSSHGLKAAAVLAGVGLLGLVGLRRLGYLHVRALERVLALRRRNLSLREDMTHVSQRIHRAAEMAEVWDAVKGAKRVLGAVSVGLQLSHGHAGEWPHGQSYRWHRIGADGVELECTRHSLLVERPGDVLELGWVPGRSLDRDTELAVESLCHDVHAALERIERGARAAGARPVSGTSAP